jgi:hypothetical protein
MATAKKGGAKGGAKKAAPKKGAAKRRGNTLAATQNGGSLCENRGWATIPLFIFIREVLGVENIVGDSQIRSCQIAASSLTILNTTPSNSSVVSILRIQLDDANFIQQPQVGGYVFSGN